MRTRIALLLTALLGLACSSNGEAVVADNPVPDSPCQTLGAQACSLADDGSWLVVRCSLDGDGELHWKSSQACEFGCQDGHCLSESGDVRPTDGTPGPDGLDADVVEPPDQVTDGPGDEDVVNDLLPDLCIPDCNNRICGDDGCGGQCGECPKDMVCLPDGSDCCMPDCTGKLCGDNGCGGTCGDCPEGTECNAYFQCMPVCVPDCEGKECGSDGCGGDCGDCPPGKGCGPEGLCTLCVPQCDGKECGDDGCGGSCGACPYGYSCKDFVCQEPCAPVCAGKDCGDDGCGGQCGVCLPGEMCVDDQCIIVCTPNCGGKECGQDGCGGSCGKCPSWAWCSPQGTCVSDCEAPDCEGKECGSDGCGGSCGLCAEDEGCNEEGLCVPAGGDCDGVPDTGLCDGNVLVICVQGAVNVIDCKEVGKNVVCEWLEATGAHGCVEQGECVPDCENKQCGSDGCGGTCGSCAVGQQCINNECIGQGPCGDVGYEGCCQGDVLLWCDNGVLWYMDCSTMINPAQQKCGWNDEMGFYDCTAESLQGPDEFPYSCQGACVPTCAYKQCGDDGCGGSCGTCPAGTECVDNICQGEGGQCGGYSEEPVCQGDSVVWCEAGAVFFQDCTELGPYYQCGWVPDLYVYGCYEEECIPDCEGKQCGDDGCGYVCGYCPVTQYCNDKNQCVFGQGMCGDVDYIGLCEGNVVKWCQNGILQEFDCGALGPTWQCGWYEDGGYYWCLDL